MRLGLFMMPLHPPGRSMHDTLAEDTEKSLLADRLGFDELWIGEHFSATTEPIPSPLMFMAGLVPQTKNLTFGTGVINLPNHHPAIVAAEVAQFDHMSGGRFMLGIGPGGLAVGLRAVRQCRRRASASACSIERIDTILRSGPQDPPYDITGEFWNVRITKAIMPEFGFGVMPKPYSSRIRRSLSRSAASIIVGAHRGGARLEHRFGQFRAELVDRGALEGPTPSAALAGSRAAPTGGCRAASWGAADAEADDRMFGAAANRYFFPYLRPLSPTPAGSTPSSRRRDARRRGDARGHHARMRDQRVATHRARQADRVPRTGRAIRHVMMGLDWGGPTPPGSARRWNGWRGGDAPIPPARAATERPKAIRQT